MQEAIPAAAAAAQTNSGAASGSQASEGNPPPQTVTLEQFQALQKELGWACKQIREFASSRNAHAAPANSAEPATVREDLSKLRTEIVSEREAAAAERRDLAIEQSVRVDGFDSEALLDHVQARHGKNIKVEGRQVYHEDPTTGERLPIAEFVKKLTSGSQGDRFRKAAAPGPRGVSGQRPNLSGAPNFTDMPQEERLKLQRENPAEYMRRLQAAAKA